MHRGRPNPHLFLSGKLDLAQIHALVGDASFGIPVFPDTPLSGAVQARLIECSFYEDYDLDYCHTLGVAAVPDITPLCNDEHEWRFDDYDEYIEAQKCANLFLDLKKAEKKFSIANQSWKQRQAKKSAG
jgi:hypothetical protein